MNLRMAEPDLLGTPVINELWKRAEGDLCLGAFCSTPDKLIWEHSARVARLAAGIASISDLDDRAVDRTALSAAALYHDAGWIVQLRAGEAIPRDVLLRPTSEVQRELAADYVHERLDDLLTPRSLVTSSRAIRFCNDRQSEMIEAQILADAENLDEIGPQAIAFMLRRQIADGKTLADLVKTWERQEEYHYWQARIKDSFHFEPVRHLALRRLQSLKRFMTDLRSVVYFEDLIHLQPAVQPDATLQSAS